MKKICVYTCITGEYDNIHEVEVVEKNIDYLLFTNNRNIKSTTWKVIYIDDEKLDNHLLSRKIKILGHPYINENYDISVWMDASVVFKKKVSLFVKKYFDNKKAPFSSFKHHSRDCIYDEAIECLKVRKDSKEKILETVEYLKKDNYPKNNGLYEMTVFIKEHNNKTVIKTMNMWFDMLCKHSKRDQLSFMYCVWKTGLKINTIDLNVWNNEYFNCYNHNVVYNMDQYRIYFGNEDNYDVDNDYDGIYEVDDDHYTFKTIVPDDVNTINIYVSKVSLLEYTDLKINDLSSDNYIIINSISYNNLDIFYNNISKIIITKKFKKGDILEFSIKMKKVDDGTLLKFIDFLGYSYKKSEIIKNENKHLKGDIQHLKNINFELENRLSNIINSKGWKLLEKIRKITK